PTDPGPIGVTTVVTVALEPEPTEFKLHVIVAPDREQLPWLGVTETSVALPGSVSVKLTPTADLGPAFETVQVSVRGGRGARLLGDAEAVTEMSAEAAGSEPVIAIATGAVPTGTVAMTDCVATSMTETVFEPLFATYAKRPSGVTVIPFG